VAGKCPRTGSGYGKNFCSVYKRCHHNRRLPPEIKHSYVGEECSLSCILPKQGIVFEEWEKNILMQALERSQGIMADAAKLLGMTYRTFQYRAEKFGLKDN
jgi:transcriptional regulator with GAF, ATPase, and Fis domain